MLYQLSYFRKILQSQACRTPQTYDSVSEDKAQLRYDSFVKDHYYIYNFVPLEEFESSPTDPWSGMLSITPQGHLESGSGVEPL